MNLISVLILTKNEEKDLPDCLASVAWSDDVHLLDSESTDATSAIAQAAGAHVSVRSFDGYASQRNYGLKLDFKHDWILILDADERITPELAIEMQIFVSSAASNIAAARLQRRDIWWGRWLKHAQISPFYVRLVRKGTAHYEREINEVLIVDGDIVDLSQPFDHHPFSKGIDHWITKHNVYSRMEAEVIANKTLFEPSIRVALFGKDFNERRKHQKTFFYKLPFRPFIKFFYMIFVRCAFLDGMPGIRYSVLQAIYEYFIVIKTKEIQINKNVKIN
jgi:glycosyltransferase involved in cell wall biosynthesis